MLTNGWLSAEGSPSTLWPISAQGATLAPPPRALPNRPLAGPGGARGGAAWGRGLEPEGAGPTGPAGFVVCAGRVRVSSSALRGVGAVVQMLAVHIPSVGPETQEPRQSPEKGHMVSGVTGWEGARAPADFPAPSAVGAPGRAVGA